MPEQFNYKNTIKSIQSRLISQSIRDTANVDFLKSEEALTEIIKSYQDRFRSARGMLFDSANYVAESATLIKIEKFNEMFESIFIDLSAMYNDLDVVDKVLKLNLGRNKNYFLVIKKRLRDLWNKLHLTRLLVYDENPSDESYYESFSTKINAKRLEDVLVDKKSGYLYLSKEYSRTHNISSLIKNITSTTYPEQSDNGGIRYTTSELNSFSDNYTNGPRDMLQHGLWKEQVLCNEVPDMVVDIGTANPVIKRNYTGIVSLIDIDFVYPVEMNRLDFDVFGELITKVDAVLYKTNSDQEWQVATFVDPNKIDAEVGFDAKISPVKGDAIDVISFQNISRINAKHLRLVLNQENYVFLDSKDMSQKTVDEKIQEDLSERRYELIKFGSDLDDILSKPINDENTSLYFRLLDIIESTTNIEQMLDQIDEILDPKISVVAYDYERTSKFEIGTWSIEPMIERFTQTIGKFNSMPYSVQNKPLSSVALVTKQSEPRSSTANWYVNIGSKDIPIVHNNNLIRKEPLYPVSMTEYAAFSDWTEGSFFLLDCPINAKLSDDIYISVNGSAFQKISDSGKIVYLNSRLIYINDIANPFEAIYTIKYPVALKTSINLYGLKSKPGITTIEDVTLDIVSSRFEVLNAFIRESFWTSKTQEDADGNPLTLSDMFEVTSVTSTIDEAKLWFGENFNTALYIGTSIDTYFNITLSDSLYSDILDKGDSKTQVMFSDVSAYLSGVSTGFSELSLIGNIPNVAPLSKMRIV